MQDLIYLKGSERLKLGKTGKENYSVKDKSQQNIIFSTPKNLPNDGLAKTNIK